MFFMHTLSFGNKGVPFFMLVLLTAKYYLERDAFRHLWVIQNRIENLDEIF